MISYALMEDSKNGVKDAGWKLDNVARLNHVLHTIKNGIEVVLWRRFPRQECAEALVLRQLWRAQAKRGHGRQDARAVGGGGG